MEAVPGGRSKDNPSHTYAIVRGLPWWEKNRQLIRSATGNRLYQGDRGVDGSSHPSRGGSLGGKWRVHRLSPLDCCTRADAVQLGKIGTKPGERTVRSELTPGVRWSVQPALLSGVDRSGALQRVRRGSVVEVFFKLFDGSPAGTAGDKQDVISLQSHVLSLCLQDLPNV